MLTYIKYGSGPTVWLAFHGIGQNAHCFEPLAHQLTHTHTIYSIELPHHGRSVLKQNQPTNWPAILTNAYWHGLVTLFLATHSINRFSVIGFSMGGRFALVTAEHFAAQIDGLLLLAPDGVTQDPWFRLATSTVAGRILLRFFLNHTHWLLKIGHGFVRIGLLSASQLRFAEVTMQTPAQREQIYRSWTSFRTLKTTMRTFAIAMTTHQVQVRLFLGQYDTVLPRRHMQPLEIALPTCQVLIIPTGHNSLVRRVAALLGT